MEINSDITIFLKTNNPSGMQTGTGRRQPVSIVKSPYPDNTQNHNSSDGKVSQAVRYIFLIRHGQYNTKGETDKERQLTELGRKQALLTGERLSALKLPWTSIAQSTMTRAMETCSLIQKHLPGDIPVSSTDLLREGAPIPPDPPHPRWKPDDYEFYQEGAQIEAAFRKFFHRAPPEQTEDSYEIIVCHANVIRYFVMRALQLPPEAWLRLSLDHASITSLAIPPGGHVILFNYSNSGYMPPDAISY
ncbi:serine/threonine-protein phosphatase PGAM5, mitochondrial-like isoform X2 [Adelges cooleyi]|uniref:serine/threonine-protein phosphatase PGAM5, mitochondrial-like isoform X2 n=1 Tax=Adelges cooleyi TaxID=133065 RepID=UPI00217F7F60|nr:serine/threonine-protein phosphatase PGAM5, mitochondrial-like isoform X2 [Adelges cooleyi]